MLIAHRNGMLLVGKQLPYDAEVEWLQSDGNQIVYTGLPIIDYTGYQVEIEYCFSTYPSGTNKESWVFGYWNNVPSARLYLAGFYRNQLRCGAGPDNSTYYCSLYRDTNFHVAKILNDGAYFDGVRRCPTALDELAIGPEHSVSLFKSPHIDNGGLRRVKYCKMWSIAGELLRDFIMVVDHNGIACVYDRVENQLHYNAGSGALAAGPALVGGGGDKPQCVRRSYRRSFRSSARFWSTPLWKEVA